MRLSDSSGAVAIRRLVAGLPVPTPGPGGECSATSFSAVSFGANFTSSCSVSLTAVQLEDFCT